MARVIFDNGAKGCVVWGPLLGGTAFDVSGPGVPSAKNCILIDFDVSYGELYDIHQCFNDKTNVYVLGSNIGACTLTLTFMTGFACDGNGMTGFEDSINEYKAKRLGSYAKLDDIVIGGEAFKCLLVGYNIGNCDPSRGLAYVTLKYVIDIN